MPDVTISYLGDAHNFGRRVTFAGTRIVKPRTLLWEHLLLASDSPLRALLTELADRDGLGKDAFAFLPDLAFTSHDAREGGEVERVELATLRTSSLGSRLSLARIVGRALALFSWLGLADLHWENLVLGKAESNDGGDRVIFAPLDVEMILADLELPTETKLLPDADPEVLEICRHACGVRRVLPYLGKPIEPECLVAMAAAYRRVLALLDHHTNAIAEVFGALPHLRTMPIRVLLRGTDEYVRVHDGASDLWPPLLDAEIEQLARGDIPYFFRLYGEQGIHYFADSSLTRIATLPMQGDVPQLEPLLRIARGLRSPSRKKLRENGLFTVLGAFDHPSFSGRYESDGLAVTFEERALVVEWRRSGELETSRDLSAFVGSVYLPCHCGEVATVFVPPITTCDAPA